MTLRRTLLLILFLNVVSRFVFVLFIMIILYIHKNVLYFTLTTFYFIWNNEMEGAVHVYFLNRCHIALTSLEISL